MSNPQDRENIADIMTVIKQALTNKLGVDVTFLANGSTDGKGWLTMYWKLDED